MYFLTGESVKSQITDSISKNLTDSDLESILYIYTLLEMFEKLQNFYVSKVT